MDHKAVRAGMQNFSLTPNITIHRSHLFRRAPSDPSPLRGSRHLDLPSAGDVLHRQITNSTCIGKLFREFVLTTREGSSAAL